MTHSRQRFQETPTSLDPSSGLRKSDFGAEGHSGSPTLCSSDRGRIPFEHPDCGSEDRLPRLSPHLEEAHLNAQIHQVNGVLLVLDNVSRQDAQGLLCARLRVADLVGVWSVRTDAEIPSVPAYFPFYARGLVFVPCAMPSFPSWRQSMSLRPVNGWPDAIFFG